MFVASKCAGELTNEAGQQVDTGCLRGCKIYAASAHFLQVMRRPHSIGCQPQQPLCVAQQQLPCRCQLPSEPLRALSKKHTLKGTI